MRCCVRFTYRAGIFVYRGFYFGLYDTIIPMLGKDVSPFTKFGVGYVVTVVAGLASYPIDTIRRRMMMTSGGDKSMQYKGAAPQLFLIYYFCWGPLLVLLSQHHCHSQFA